MCCDVLLKDIRITCVKDYICSDSSEAKSFQSRQYLGGKIAVHSFSTHNKVIMIKSNYGRLIQHLFATFIAVLPSLSLGSSADQISITQARIEHEAGRAILIDIRESSEHQTGVAKNAVLLPMSQLLQKQSIIQKSSNKPILLICNTQNRSKVILAKLKNQGYQNIQYVDGGMSEWAAKGWPMVKP